MIHSPRCRLQLVLVITLLLAAVIPVARADQPTHLRFSTDSFLVGATAPFLYAAQKGMFAARNIDMDVEPSSGSGDCISKIAAGSSDAGYADLSTLIEFTARHPDQAPVAVMIMMDHSPQAIISFRKAGIEKPADLIGKRIGTAQLDAASRMFPLFARLTNLPMSQLNLIPVDQQLRDTLFARGEFDAVIGFDYTIMFKVAALTHNFDDMRAMYVRDYGLDLYGNAVIVSQRLIKSNPAAVAGVVAAAAEGWIRGEQDRDGVIAALIQRDPLMQAPVERARLDWALSGLIMTPNVMAHGLGYTEPARLQKNVDFVVEGFGLPRKPAVSDVVSDAFLPPEEARHFR